MFSDGEFSICLLVVLLLFYFFIDVYFNKTIRDDAKKNRQKIAFLLLLIPLVSTGEKSIIVRFFTHPSLFHVYCVVFVCDREI